MHNPFRLPLLMLNSRRPSRIGEMPTVRDGLWLRKGYDALTFFGHIVVATDEMVEEMKEKASPLRNHEMIHLRQAQSTHDSWFFFYLLYIWYYVKALPANRKYRNAAYLLNPFEVEAYLHMADADYLQKPECGQEWRRFAEMKPIERINYYKHLKK
jgi:hypothetical protein